MLPTLVVLVFAMATGIVAASFDWSQVKYVYAFGDSYSFVQGALGHANFRSDGRS